MEDFEVILRDGNEERKVKEGAEEGREMKIHSKLACVSLVVIKKLWKDEELESISRKKKMSSVTGRSEGLISDPTSECYKPGVWCAEEGPEVEEMFGKSRNEWRTEKEKKNIC